MMTNVLISAAWLGIASLLGSGIGLIIKRIPHKWNDIFLGCCAGMMVAASLVCLILPAIDMVPLGQIWQPLVGVAAGVALISLLDYVTPHLHKLSGLETEKHHNKTTADKVLLFVLAIALHKFPEGLAAGVSFNDGDLGNAYALSITLALQNIPEGMVVVTPLIMVGVRPLRVLGIALIVAALEVAGVCAGFWLGEISSLFLPALTAMAGGAMLYIISDEMIPETHAHGFEKPATYALIAGVMLMLMIERM